MAFAKACFTFALIFLCSNVVFGQHFDCPSCVNYSASTNYIPVWAQIGNVNPYYRPAVSAIWQNYSPVNAWQGAPSYPAVQPSIQSWSSNGGLILNPPISTMSPIVEGTVLNGTVIEGTISNPPLASEPIVDGDLSESISPVDVNLEVESESIDSQDSPSDLTVEQTPDQPVDSESGQLREQLAQKENEIARLQASLEEMALSQDVQEASRKTTETVELSNEENQKLIEEAVSTAKKEAAWEVAKLRKESEQAKVAAEKARELAAAAKRRAKVEREKFTSKIQNLEDRLAEGKRNSQTKQSGDGEKKGNDGKTRVKAQKSTKKSTKKTLAEMAEEKRRKRQASDNTENAGVSGEQGGKDKNGQKSETKNSESEMQKQIDRAIAKIKRRFDAKIDRAKDGDDADKQVTKLEKEMKIQMEKMEARIRNRFKNRN